MSSRLHSVMSSLDFGGACCFVSQDFALVRGVHFFCRCMSLSLAPHGVRVNAIGPGSIMTEVLSAVVGDKAALSR